MFFFFSTLRKSLSTLGKFRKQVANKMVLNLGDFMQAIFIESWVVKGQDRYSSVTNDSEQNLDPATPCHLRRDSAKTDTAAEEFMPEICIHSCFTGGHLHVSLQGR